MSACENSSQTSGNNVEAENIQTYSSTVKKIYNDVPFSKAGIEMSHMGISVSEQKVDFIFNAFDEQKLKNEKEAEKFMKDILTKEEQGILRVTYDPGVKNQVGG